MLANNGPDPRLTKAIQALDQERRLRIKAEQGQRALRNTLRRVLATQDQQAAELREARVKLQAARAGQGPFRDPILP
jgi:hypothetical protein